MAMGGTGQRKAQSAICNHQPFKNSTGSLRGTEGGTRQLGWLSSHSARDRLQRMLAQASYVVWSYDTPIGFVVPDDPEDPGASYAQYVVEESFSPTTSHHQTLCRVGFEYYLDPCTGETSAEVQERREARRAPRSAPPEFRLPTDVGWEQEAAHLSYNRNESLMHDITGLFLKPKGQR